MLSFEWSCIQTRAHATDTVDPDFNCESGQT